MRKWCEKCKAFKLSSLLFKLAFHTILRFLILWAILVIAISAAPKSLARSLEKRSKNSNKIIQQGNSTRQVQTGTVYRFVFVWCDYTSEMEASCLILPV